MGVFARGKRFSKTYPVLSRLRPANPDLSRLSLFLYLNSPQAAVGTALYPRDGTTSFELLRAADQAMYSDKGHVSAERSL